MPGQFEEVHASSTAVVVANGTCTLTPPTMAYVQNSVYPNQGARPTIVASAAILFLDRRPAVSAQPITRTTTSPALGLLRTWRPSGGEPSGDEKIRQREPGGESKEARAEACGQGSPSRLVQFRRQSFRLFHARDRHWYLMPLRHVLAVTP